MDKKAIRAKLEYVLTVVNIAVMNDRGTPDHEGKPLVHQLADSAGDLEECLEMLKEPPFFPRPEKKLLTWYRNYPQYGINALMCARGFIYAQTQNMRGHVTSWYLSSGGGRELQGPQISNLYTLSALKAEQAYRELLQELSRKLMTEHPHMQVRYPMVEKYPSFKPGITEEQLMSMLHNQGIYIISDTEEPNAEIVVVSMHGSLYSTQLDEILDPGKFLPTAVVAGGPYRARRRPSKE